MFHSGINKLQLFVLNSLLINNLIVASNVNYLTEVFFKNLRNDPYIRGKFHLHLFLSLNLHNPGLLFYPRQKSYSTLGRVCGQKGD